MNKMDRRSFIRGIAGFASLIVMPGMSAALAESEAERLKRLMGTGFVEGEKFYLENPVVISGIKNLRVTRCIFLLREKLPPGLSWLVFNDSKHVEIDSCVFGHVESEWRNIDASTLRYDATMDRLIGVRHG